MTLRPVRLALALVPLLALAGCVTAGYPGGTATPVPSPAPSQTLLAPSQTLLAQSQASPTPTPSPSVGSRLALELVVDGLAAPLDVAAPDDGGADLLVAEQEGRIVRLPGGHTPAAVFLDIRDRVLAGGERGLLGLALHPGYAANGRFFVDYTDLDGNTVVAEYGRRADGEGDPTSERVVLFVEQPAANHNGGAIRFGRDRMLYVALGDGGGGGSANGHRRDTLLGKILRLDVDTPPPPGRGYVVPPDNPFVRVPGVRPEIWATGLRNPWRFSMDPATGDLWIGDVGAGDREEVDVARAGVGGLDFGWDLREGTLCTGVGACDEAGLTPPVAEYDHGRGCVVTGGIVYRGTDLPALAGRYLFGDYCSGAIWWIDARGDAAGLQVPELLLETGRAVVSFGVDVGGEVLVVDHRGALLRLVRAP